MPNNTPLVMEEELKKDLAIISSHSKENIEDLSNEIMNGFYGVLETILGNEDMWVGTDCQSIQKVINALAISASNVITSSHEIITTSYNSVFNELLPALKKYEKEIEEYNAKLIELNNAQRNYNGLIVRKNTLESEEVL